MRNLVPEFVIAKYLEKNYQGEFTAYSIFIDISGFTSTTEALMKHGKEGAEVLSDILEFLFSTSVDSIYSNGGFITRFAGDAFTALFIAEEEDKELSKRILNSALTIQKFFKTHRIYHSKFGDFEFAVKVGISYGKVDWGIVGKDHSKSYYFKGYAVDHCAYAEHHCEKGDICADEKFMSKIPTLILNKKQKSNTGTAFYRIDKTKNFKVSQHPSAETVFSEEIISIFTGKNELHFPAGEFREAFSVFISFENVSDLDTFMNVVIDQQEAYGGSHPHLDFGDKGGNVLVFFGAPVSYENNEQRALKFILGIRDHMEPTIRLRAGISQGILYAGYNGVERRQEFTCLGNTVNQSARYMMKAEWNETLTCDRTSRNDSFEFEHVGDFEFKGRSGTIPTYRLIREANRRQTVFTGKQYGRIDETKQLMLTLNPLKKGKNGGIVYIDGIAGIGKSRLIHELRKNSKKNAFTWLDMRCDGILRKSFNPIIFFFEHYFSQSPEYSQKKNKKLFEEKINSLISSTTQEDIKKELERSYSFLGHLVNLHWKDSLFEKLDAKSRYENMLYAFKNLVKAESLLNGFGARLLLTFLFFFIFFWIVYFYFLSFN
ncbi:MAG: adenylate/guanylate cyclase domain-containing protein [Fidelibacterota bacterium]